MRHFLAFGVALSLLTTACGPREVARPALTPTVPAPVEIRQVPPVRQMPQPPPTPLAPTSRAQTGASAPLAEATLLPVPTILGATPAPQAASTPEPVLDGLLDDILPEPSGADYGLVVEDLDTGARVAVNDQQVFPSASLYKLGVAWLVLRQAETGQLDLDDPLPILVEDSVEPEPRGGVAAGDSPTIRQALGVMLSASSNAAAHAFLRVIGRDEFNRQMQAIGLNQTRVPDDEQADDADAFAVTSAADIAHLLRLLATTHLLSATSREELTEWLATIGRPDALRESLPSGVDVLDKTGNLRDASDVGALLESPRGTAILVVVDHGVDPAEARGVIAQLAGVAYQALLESSN